MNKILFQTRLLEGTYPDTFKIIPTSFPTVISFNKEALLRRYKETRRNHPLMKKEGLTLEEAIDKGIYCEISPSGKGSRLFSLGQLPINCPKKQGSLEIYDDGRFLTVTGHQVMGGSNE